MHSQGKPENKLIIDVEHDADNPEGTQRPASTANIPARPYSEITATADFPDKCTSTAGAPALKQKPRLKYHQQ